MEEAYKYKPLTKSDSIRLIVLQPSLDEDAIIHYNFIYTTLREARDEIYDHYTALSYVWGKPVKWNKNLVDGCVLWITDSLHAALQHLRDGKREFRIWADAICINQDNGLEKNEQVQQIGEIYATAHHTVIFLGVCSPEDEHALARLLTFCDEDTENGRITQDFAAVVGLLESPWFYRVWISQELLMSEDPKIQYGRTRMPWDDLCKIIEKLV